MKSKEQTFTPKGLTQNWNFLEHFKKSSRKRLGGEYKSRLKRHVPIETRVKLQTPECILIKNENPEIGFDSKLLDSGEVSVTLRKNGKFTKGTAQIYSASLASKLGLI